MKTLNTTSLATTLQCPHCHKLYDIDERQSFATCCNQPLLTNYDLELPKSYLLHVSEQSIWRYAKLLPVFDKHNIVSLGEGWTPIS
jgi:threonine synthase